MDASETPNPNEESHRIASTASMSSTDDETTQIFIKSQSGSPPTSRDASTTPSTYEEDATAAATSETTEQCTVFDRVTFIGSSPVDAPVSEVETKRTVETLRRRANASDFVAVKLSVPSSSDGSLKLYDDETGLQLAKHDVRNVLFCARSNEVGLDDCLAFTTGHRKSGTFRCHVFRAADRDAASHILRCIGNAFQNPNDVNSGDQHKFDSLEFNFDVTLDMLEEDGKGGFSSVARDRDCFKLKQNLLKKVVLTITQTSNKQLNIERCFGILLGVGRNVDRTKFLLLEVPQAGPTKKNSFEVSSLWSPAKEESLAILNAETPKDSRLHITVAVDVVISCLTVPLRFTREIPVRVYRQTERFWRPLLAKQPSVETFRVVLKEDETAGDVPDGKFHFVIEKIELLKKKAINWPMSFLIGRAKESAGDDVTASDSDSHFDEADDDDDEPILSGTGQVDSSWTDDQLSSWSDLINKWDGHTRSKQLVQLVRKGIPEKLRGQVWQMLSNATESMKIIEDFPVLVAKDSPCEQVIQWDINRTFPGHEFFQDRQGEGQAALYKISKAYSVYDTEVGYCQGLSFLTAVLLLHMPEEQAFAVLVKIMFDYGLRDLFRNNFEFLHLYLYQLKRLVEVELPDLHGHFVEHGVEPHMFASQWFLTLFTAKFPLPLVYRIMDIILCDGISVVFKIALSLLKGSRKEFIAQSFEGILKHFRVSLPKKYSSHREIGTLLGQAMSAKVDSKRLGKLEKEYRAMKEAEAEEEDPVNRLQRENKSLQEAYLRLEQENDLLAQELVASKITLRHDMDKLEHRIDTLSKERGKAVRELAEGNERVARYKEEAAGLKELYQKAVLDLEAERQQHDAEMAEYKLVRQQLDEKMQKEQEDLRQELLEMKARCYSVNDDERKSPDSTASPADLSSEKRLRDMEVELAHYKLQLVESECRVQELERQLKTEKLQQTTKRKSWLSKLKSSS